MNDLELRVKELEAIVVELYKRVKKLEKPNNLISTSDDDWFRRLRQDALKSK